MDNPLTVRIFNGIEDGCIDFRDIFDRNVVRCLDIFT